MNNKIILNKKNNKLSIFLKYFLFFLFLIILSYIRFHFRIIQQDNYVGYAEYFHNGLKDLPAYEHRLYPGLPILIYMISNILGNYTLGAYLTIYFSVIACLITLKKIAPLGKYYIFFIFPPIMLASATQISTEYICIFLILLTIYFVKNKNYTHACLISGLNFWIRPVGSFTFFALIISLFLKQEKIKLKYILAYLIPIILLILFNYHFFNRFSLTYQIQKYIQFSPYGNTIGFIQIFIDLFRSIYKYQFNILISGTFYFVLFILFFIKSVNVIKKYNNFVNIFLFTSILLMSIFIFSFTFSPFLENLGRYLMPVYSIFWIMFYKDFRISNVNIILLTILSSIIVII